MMFTRVLRPVASTAVRLTALRSMGHSTGGATGSKRYMAVAAATAAATLAAGAGLAYAEAGPVWYNPLTWQFWNVFGSAPSTSGSGAVDYDKLRADIEDIVLDKAAGPILVRLAWHASGTYGARGHEGSAGKDRRREITEEEERESCCDCCGSVDF